MIEKFRMPDANITGTSGVSENNPNDVRKKQKEANFHKSLEESGNRMLTDFYNMTPENRLPALVKSLLVYKKFVPSELYQSVTSGLQGVSQESLESFLYESKKVLAPLLQFLNKDPYQFEEWARDNSSEGSTLTSVNQLLVYEKIDNEIVLHIDLNRLTDDFKILKLLRDGLTTLALTVKNDPTIQRISGTSWIIKENPRILQLLGFTVQEPGADEERNASDRKAVISRDDFLKKYLN